MTENQFNKLKEYLGKEAVPKVKEKLKSKNIIVSDRLIYSVLSHKRENLNISIALIECYQEEKHKRTKIKA